MWIILKLQDLKYKKAISENEYELLEPSLSEQISNIKKAFIFKDNEQKLISYERQNFGNNFFKRINETLQLFSNQNFSWNDWKKTRSRSQMDKTSNYEEKSVKFFNNIVNEISVIIFNDYYFDIKKNTYFKKLISKL